MIPKESPEALAARISQAIATKLGTNAKCLRLLQFDLLWHLQALEWAEEAKERRAAAVPPAESTQSEIIWADQPDQE